jgi:hypothetical protein
MKAMQKSNEGHEATILSLRTKIGDITADLRAARMAIESYKLTRTKDIVAMDSLRQQTVTAQTEIAVLKSATNDHFLDLQRQINDICSVNMSLSRQLTQSLQIQTEQASKIAEYTFMGRYFDYFESDIKTLQRAARINSHDWRIFEDDICTERRDGCRMQQLGFYHCFTVLPTEGWSNFASRLDMIPKRFQWR